MSKCSKFVFCARNVKSQHVKNLCHYPTDSSSVVCVFWDCQDFSLFRCKNIFKLSLLLFHTTEKKIETKGLLKKNQCIINILLGTQPAAINPSKVVLLPPTETTAIPQGNAPIIVPNLSPPPVELPLYEDPGVSSKGDGTPPTTGSVETPEFLNDQQMFNYVSSMLLKVLHDCEPLLGVSF